MSSLLPGLLVVAESRRDALAIVSDGLRLTYGELYGRAWELARRLALAGCGPESVVALDLPRGPEHVVAVLGTWLAGAAFAPVDERYPEQRKRRALELVQAKLVLTSADIPAFSGEAREAPEADGERLAYVICSSGTTGVPKAVAVTHRGLPAVIEAQVALFAIGVASQVLWSLSPAFDASISDIMTTLRAGATLHITPAAQLVPGLTLEATLAERGITHWDVPPAVLRRMDAALLPACVETLVIGGEVTPPPVVRAFAQRCRLVNVYGPTEASICTSMVRCDASTWSRPLIGSPVPGVRYRVDDDELLIGGPALAREYLGDPELTARRFVLVDGQRWYRTRDRVRATSDGGLEFVGRIDRQLKLNGVLVEPEEIEACLSQCPGVERAAVQLRSGVDADVLVAFVAPHVSAATVRAHLERSLPATHQPGRIESLPELPLGSSGKVDYEALARVPVASVRGQADGGVLGQLWAQVLGVPGIGLDDDVRALGATSLDVLMVTAKAHASGLALSPEALASRRTVRAMLAHASGPLSAAWLADDVARLALHPRATHVATVAVGDRVLVTGATGFIGSRLVLELLDAGRDVVCLVRAADDDAAWSRLRAAAKPHGRDLQPRMRLTVLRGDLASEMLGLDVARWNELAATVSHVVHCGARVDMLASYGELREVNVRGTRRVLDFCRSGIPKRLLHVSTLSVLAAADHTGSPQRFDDGFPLERTLRVHGGYAQTKWAAELMVAQAAPELERLTCVRLGLVVGDAQTGYTPRHDLLAMVVRDLKQLAGLPRGLAGLRAGAMPVDYAARALVALMAHGDGPTTYHLVSDEGMTLAMLRNALTELGHVFRDVERDVWLATCGTAPTLATAALCHALEPERFAAYRALNPFDASHLDFDGAATRTALAAAGLPACPAVTAERVRAFVRYVTSDA